MPSAGEYRQGRTGGVRFVGPAETVSVVVNVNKNAQAPFILYRFPAAGYVQKAFVFSEYSTGGTTLQPTLKNAGIDGSGTIVLTATATGTFLAGSAYRFTLDPFGSGPEAFAEGELVQISFAGGLNPAVDIQIQLDVALDAVPSGNAAPLNPPAA